MLFQLDEYPLLTSGQVQLTPQSLFRVENKPFYIDPLAGETPVMGNALMMFTGLISKDKATGTDFIHCVPIHFYGKSAKDLKIRYRGQDLWIEIMSPQFIQDFGPGYFN